MVVTMMMATVTGAVTLNGSCSASKRSGCWKHVVRGAVARNESGQARRKDYREEECSKLNANDRMAEPHAVRDKFNQL